MTKEEFSQRYLQQLNPQQLDAVWAVDGAVLLLAVPGSGKTTVLVNRLGYMTLCRGIPVEQILTMTYTRAATREMEQRFGQLFGDQCPGQARFHTINSLSLQIIQYYASVNGQRWPLSIPQKGEDVLFLYRILQEVNGEYPTDSTIKEAQRAIAYAKNQMLQVEEIETNVPGIDHLATIFTQYRKAMRSAQLMDFDDQMVYAHQILTQSPEVLAHFQDQYPYICVDESQDTSKIQHTIISLLAKKHGNLFMVGDEDQSIYGFRAAYPEALLHFEADYPNARVLLMEQNYRSTEQIVSLANQFISRNRARHPKSSRPTQGSGLPIRLIQMEERTTQYKYILDLARSCQSDTAILFRNNDSALPLIDLFDRQGIPHRFRGSDDAFFSHKIVQDIVDMIHFAQNPKDTERFLRLYYKFGGGISKEAAQAACEASQRSGQDILTELLKTDRLSSRGRESAQDLVTMLPQLLQAPALDALNTLWRTLSYGEYVKLRNLDAGKYDILCMLARQEATPLTFLERLDALRNLIRNPAPAPACRLTLSTIHSSKGLEYPHVILMDVFDGVLPAKTRGDLEDVADWKLYEEERRLCYVAMTRAQRELTLLRIRSSPSEFLSELEASLPRIAYPDEDVFAPLGGDFLGKTYTHATRGKGTVLAQGEEELLIEFAPWDTARMTLAQMLQQRKPPTPLAPTGAKPPNPGPKKPRSLRSLAPGSLLHHKFFGEGVVLSIQSDIAKIQFGKEFGTKSILLSHSLEKGIIW